MTWAYIDPVGASESGSRGIAAYDPLGNYVRHFAPVGSQPDFHGPASNGAWSTFTNPQNLSTGCVSASGVPTDCSSLARQQMGDAFADNLPGVYNDMARSEQQYANGVFVAIDTSQRRRGIEGQQVQYTAEQMRAHMSGYRNADGLFDLDLGNARTGGEFNQGGTSQETPLTPREVDILRDDVRLVLSDEGCSKYYSALLTELKRITGISNYNTTDPMTIFGKVESQGGFHRKAADTATGIAWGGGGPNNGKITVNTNYMSFSDITNPSFGFDRGYLIIHEIMHVSGYGHREMAIAARNVALAQRLPSKFIGLLPKRSDYKGKKGLAAFDTANAKYYNGISVMCRGIK